jgi:hypothetical protein
MIRVMVNRRQSSLAKGWHCSKPHPAPTGSVANEQKQELSQQRVQRQVHHKMLLIQAD